MVLETTFVTCAEFWAGFTTVWVEDPAHNERGRFTLSSVPAAHAERQTGDRAAHPLARSRVLGHRLLLVADHVHDRVDECEVGEGLGEVAEVAAGRGLELLGVEVQR